jgi:hypothetical protein
VRVLFILFLLVLSGCYKNHLYVQQQSVNKYYLASSKVDTPDFRQKNPPDDEQIVVAWDFPISEFRKDLNLKLTVRFWDNQEVDKSCHLKRKRGFKKFVFTNLENEKNKRILTYKVDVFDKNNNLVSQWEHQFWTKLIDFQEEFDLQADKKN